MNEGATRTRVGVIASIVSSALFAGVFILAGLLPVDGTTLFGLRTVFMAVVLLLMLTAARRWGGMRVLARRIRNRPRLGLALLLSAAMLGAQQWLFVWAPAQGHGLELALGYFVMPIVLALVGRIVFRERLGPWRVAAVAVASAAVAYQAIVIGGLGWVTLAVALGYPVYFAVRRLAGIGGMAGITAETVLALPVAVWVLGLDPELPGALADAGTLWLIIGFGVLAAIALSLYIYASGKLPLSLFGLLSYLEPLGLALAAALVLREPLPAQELPTYLVIALALVLLALESAARSRPPRNEPIVS